MAKRQTQDENFLKWLDERFDRIIEKQDATHAEVKKTNGRVTALENWRSKMRGAWYAIVIVATVFGVVVGWAISLLTK